MNSKKEALFYFISGYTNKYISDHIPKDVFLVKLEEAVSYYNRSQGTNFDWHVIEQEYLGGFWNMEGEIK